MPSLESALIFTLLITTFPFSMAQMEVALDQEDMEAFYLWMCLACLVAGVPFIVWAWFSLEAKLLCDRIYEDYKFTAVNINIHDGWDVAAIDGGRRQVTEQKVLILAILYHRMMSRADIQPSANAETEAIRWFLIAKRRCLRAKY